MQAAGSPQCNDAANVVAYFTRGSNGVQAHSRVVSASVGTAVHRWRLGWWSAPLWGAAGAAVWGQRISGYSWRWGQRISGYSCVGSAHIRVQLCGVSASQGTAAGGVSASRGTAAGTAGAAWRGRRLHTSAAQSSRAPAAAWGQAMARRLQGGQGRADEHRRGRRRRVRAHL